MESSDLVFTVALVAFLIVVAVVVYRIVWLRHVRADAHLLSHKPQQPTEERPEWERIVTGEKDLVP